jgi:hypothetical protein
MKLADQWRRIVSELPEDWGEARLDVTVPRADERDRAAALLGPANPGRLGDRLRLSVHRGGGGVGPDGAGRLLGRVDAERIRGSISLVEVVEREARVAEALAPDSAPRGPLADAWGAALAALPPDWSDLLCELELTSTDHVDSAALLTAPLNPTRVGLRSALRFRAARAAGYGASPEMTRRCLTRLDEAAIPGRITILRALSDTDNVATQGTVWRVGGRAV